MGRTFVRTERLALLSSVAPMGEASHQSDDEELLLARCRLGDRAALRELYERNVRMVMGMARRLGTPAAEMEGRRPRMSLRLPFAISQRCGPGALTVWLFKLTSHRVHDRHRRHRVREAFARALAWLGQCLRGRRAGTSASAAGCDAPRGADSGQDEPQEARGLRAVRVAGVGRRGNRPAAGDSTRHRLVETVPRPSRIHEDRPVTRPV